MGSAAQSLLASVADAADRAPPSPDPRPTIRSFDVFDTLVARRCIEPHRIFEIVGARAGVANFPQARIAAEATVAGQPYDLDAIYAALSSALGLSCAQANDLKALEIALELENAIPVAEHVASVRDGDILISDMYLGAGVIGGLLDAVGFRPRAALLVTCDGKQSGRIWPALLAKFAIEEHLGDNLHSDVGMPQRFGIRSRHTSATAPNIVEKTLLEAGLRDLAQICREARLTTWSDDAEFRALQTVQASLNFPILVLSSIAVARLCQRHALGSVLFSSRDCNLWLKLFRVVAGQLGLTCTADYFYTSRIMRTRPSADYLDYARETIRPDTLVADICGTGWSLAHLFRHLELSGQPVFLLHKLPSFDRYERQAPAPQTCTLYALVDGVEDRCQNTMLEMCNYAEHGMVSDVRRIGNAALPVFAADRRPPRTRAAVAAQQACFLQAVDVLARQGLDTCLSIDDASLRTLCTALYQCLSQQQALYAAFAKPHFEEDMMVMRDLGCL